MAIYRNDADFTLPYHRPAVVDESTGLVIRGACIRLEEDGCRIHANDAHINVGIRTVQVSESSGDLVLYMDGEGPVVTATVVGDETIHGERGIVMGIRRGTSTLSVRFYDTASGRRLNLADRSDYLLVAGPASNVWVHFVGATA